MTKLVNSAASFAAEALQGFVAAHPTRVRAVVGGVVRATPTSPGQVAVVLGGGSGHYPAFAGWVGAGMAHGAVCGNVFAAPAASQVYSVARAAQAGGGVVLGFGNYAGDVLQFGAAAEHLRGEGVDVRIVTTTDDLASAPPAARDQRRGIAGNLSVFKILGAAAEAGLPIQDVEAIGRRANSATRSLGVAFAGCTLPGAERPLFTLPRATMAVGMGIHGEPGLREDGLPPADDVADLLLDGVLADGAPNASGDAQLAGFDGHVAVVLNGLGTLTQEELFLIYRRVSARLSALGLVAVAPEVGNHVTSLDMSGVSLTVTYLDDDLEHWWCAPVETPAFRRGLIPATARESHEEAAELEGAVPANRPPRRVAAEPSRWAAGHIARALRLAVETVEGHEAELGHLDAVTGDGDHGMAMSRGARAAADAAGQAANGGAGAGTLLTEAGRAWSDAAGGTSGALWGVGLREAGTLLGDRDAVTPANAVAAVAAAIDAMCRLGGAQPGDKTIIDAATPFLSALTTEVAAGADLSAAWRAASVAATEAARSTASFGARLGRARIHGDRGIGTPDAGATSFSLVVSAACAAFGMPRQLEDA